MGIDERLEALAQSVELLVSMHKDNERRLDEHIRRYTEEMKTMAKRNLRLEHFITDIAQGTARLLHVVEAHEQRLSDLEGNQAQ